MAKRKRCAACGDLTPIEDTKTCPLCKEVMCNVCLDENYEACDNCVHDVVQAEIDLPRVDIIVAARAAAKALNDVLKRVVYHG